jgi:hypothetical protein
LRLSNVSACVNPSSPQAPRNLKQTIRKQDGSLALQYPATLYPESNAKNSFDAEMSATKTRQNGLNKCHLRSQKMPQNAKNNQN